MRPCLRIAAGVRLLPGDRCGDRRESDSAGTPAHREGTSVAKAIHTMIRVLDLDLSIDFYRRAFGLEVANRFDFHGFTLV